MPSGDACLLDSNILLRISKSDDPQHAAISHALRALVGQARRRFDVVVSHMNPNSILFLWWLNKNSPDDAKAITCDSGWPIWACGLLGRGMAAYYAGSGDNRVLQALEAGCHVLGEKPISNEIDRAKEMVAKAREKGLCYGINLNHRFTPAARIAKRWQEEGKLGHLLSVNVSHPVGSLL
jgi:hypothetical protein